MNYTELFALVLSSSFTWYCLHTACSILYSPILAAKKYFLSVQLT